MFIIIGNEHMICVQNLDEAAGISHSANSHGKTLNPTILSTAQVK